MKLLDGLASFNELLKVDKCFKALAKTFYNPEIASSYSIVWFYRSTAVLK